MTAAAFALRKGVFACLSGDPAVLAALGGLRINDQVPRAKEPPLLVLGEGSVRDWPTWPDCGHEHGLTLTVWSEEGGSAQVFAIADAAVAALEAMPAALDGHRLVNLVALATEVRRDAEGRLVRGTIRLRAVTEVAP